MKRSHTTAGIFNPRVLVAFTLCSLGAWLMIFGFGAVRGSTSAPTAGARIYVTTTAQKIGGIGTGGCSLQEAIYSSVLHNSLDGGAHGIAIDATDPDHFITTECVMGTGNGDTIVLPTNGVFNLTTYLDGDAYNPYGPTATPIIFSTVTIEGAGATLQWMGGDANVRLFALGPASITINQASLNTTVSGTGGLTLRDVYIKGFHVKGGDGASGGGGGLGAGGAIYVQNGTLIVENSTFDGNGAVGGNGAGGNRGGGGGIWGNGGASGSNGFGGGGGGSKGNGGASSDYSAPGGGGGTVFSGGDGTPTSDGAGGYLCGGSGGADGGSGKCPGGGGGGGGHCRVFCSGKGGSGAYGGGGGGGIDSGGAGGIGGGGGSGNSGGAGSFGGGGGTPNGYSPGFGGNADDSHGGGGGALGGAIFNDSGNLTVHNSTFYNNFVSRGVGGGGSAGNGGDAGGAIFSRNGSTTIVNSTISGNQSTGRAAGVSVWWVDSTPCSFTLNDTIIANNGGSYECDFRDVTPTGTHNLITGYTFCPGVVTNVDPQLGPLQPPSVNGGKTPTMAIPLYSSAMGVADPGTSLPYDQRFADRPQPDKAPRNGYDIGAMQVCRRFIGPSLGYGPCGETHITPPPTTTLTMAAAGAGTTDRAPGTYNVPVDSVIPIMATPDWGYAFWHWTTNVADHTNPSTTVIMNQAQSVTAAFVTLRLTNASATNSHLTVTFQASGDSRGDYVYRLERSPSLSPPNWQSIPGVNNIQPARPGTYSMTDTTNSISSGQAFYRVRVLP